MDWRVKMIAKIKMIAESLGKRRVSGESVSDEMLELGIWQFGDGMGFTTILGDTCGDAKDDVTEKVCTA